MEPAKPPTERPWLARATAAARASGQKAHRSKITNGSKLLAGVNGNSTWVRRFKDLIAEHLVDLGGGDQASSAERSLVRRAAAITTELEFLEARFATAGDGAKPEDLDLYFRGSNNLRRLLETVGLQRRAKDVSPPSVADYLGHVNKQTQTIDQEPSP